MNFHRLREEESPNRTFIRSRRARSRAIQRLAMLRLRGRITAVTSPRNSSGATGGSLTESASPQVTSRSSPSFVLVDVTR